MQKVASGTWGCPRCGGSVPTSYAPGFCIFCGMKRSEGWTCVECQAHVISNEYSYCTGCGAPRGRIPEQVPPPLRRVSKGGQGSCPQCGAHTFAGQRLCGGCRQELIFCNLCGAANLAWYDFCHNCGRAVGSKTVELPRKPTPPVVQPAVVAAKEDLVKPIQSLEYPQIERMRICDSCKKVIGDGELFCSYCGAKQMILRPYREAILDPHAMKVALTMLSRVTDAKEHPEYSIIDQLTTMIGEVALGKEKTTGRARAILLGPTQAAYTRF